MTQLPAAAGPTLTAEERVVERLLRRIEARAGELVGLACALVAIDSRNPPGRGYTELAQLIGERLAGRGCEVAYERALGAPGDSEAAPRSNLLARAEGKVAGPVVHITGHLDTAADAGGGGPGLVENGRLSGPGADRVKGAIAAATIGLETLKDELPRLPGAIELSLTADGLSGHAGGVEFLAQLGYFAPERAQHVLVLAPLGVDTIGAAGGGSLLADALGLAIPRVLARPARQAALPRYSALSVLAENGGLAGLVAYGPSAAATDSVAVADLVAAAKIVALAAHRLLTTGPKPPEPERPAEGQERGD